MEPSRLVGAVDELATINRGARNPEIEIRLRDLRHRAASALEPSTGRPDWPPRYDDPFPSVVGHPPEIHAQELSTEILGGAVAHHGALVVRNAFDDRQVARAIDAIDRARAGFQDASANPSAEGNDAWYHPFHVHPKFENQILRNTVVYGGGLWLADSPAATEQVLGDLEEAGVTPPSLATSESAPSSRCRSRHCDVRLRSIARWLGTRTVPSSLRGFAR